MLTGPEIARLIEETKGDNIHCSPYNPKHINPNSIDVCLGDTLKVFGPAQECVMGQVPESYSDHRIIDPKDDNEFNVIKQVKWSKYNYDIDKNIPDRRAFEGWNLMPGCLYLGHTKEEIGSDSYIPMLNGKSSIGRLGINVHITAGFGDIGFKKQWTLEISVLHPVILYPGMRIAQVCFFEPNGAVQLYDGKYTEQKGAQPAIPYKQGDKDG